MADAARYDHGLSHRSSTLTIRYAETSKDATGAPPRLPVPTGRTMLKATMAAGAPPWLPMPPQPTTTTAAAAAVATTRRYRRDGPMLRKVHHDGPVPTADAEERTMPKAHPSWLPMPSPFDLPLPTTNRSNYACCFRSAPRHRRPLRRRFLLRFAIVAASALSSPSPTTNRSSITTTAAGVMAIQIDNQVQHTYGTIPPSLIRRCRVVINFDTSSVSY